MKDIKAKNILLGLTPLCALTAILSGQSEWTAVRMVFAGIAAVLFITYIALFIRHKQNTKE